MLIWGALPKRVDTSQVFVTWFQVNEDWLNICHEILPLKTIYSVDAMGRLHSAGDQPAVKFSDGIQIWFSRGLRHRDNDLPAVIFSNRGKE